MTDLSSLSDTAQTDTAQTGRPVAAETHVNRYTLAALQRHKREGLDMALRARWIGLGLVAVLIVFLNPRWEVVYYHAGLALLAYTGYLHRQVGRVGRSRAELAILAFDLSLATAMFVLPNPLATDTWPTATIYRFDNFLYFFMLLALGTLAYSWRTIMAIGTWTAGLWALAALGVSYFGYTDPALSEAARVAFGKDPKLLEIFDPNAIQWDIRLQQIAVFLLVAAILAITVRRFDDLVLGHAALERERANLSRYFAPTVVDELSRNDEPLKQIRQQDVAVLFVDIRGFTAYAAGRPPEEVIATLRDFIGRMEDAVFRQAGTLDKFLGDGLMATFGTPLPHDDDASRALACLRAMLRELDHFNEDRRRAGLDELVAGFGLHYGPVVLGDVGRNRLEFAVIGSTVNTAARLEAATRELDKRAVISEALARQVEVEGHGAMLDGWHPGPAQVLKGLQDPVAIRVLS